MPISTRNFRKGLDLRIESGVAYLTLDRPESRNALSRELIEGLDDALEHLSINESVRVIVLGSTGSVFSSGHDLNELLKANEAELKAIFGACARMMKRLHTIPQPVVAWVQGHAVAAGCQLVAACDLAVAAEQAAFSTPGIKIGLFCATPMIPLVRAIGPKSASEMVFTGQPISANRALALGLINRVASAEQLDSTIAQLIAPILSASPDAIRTGKSIFWETIELDEHEAYLAATETMITSALSHDAKEGISAFLEKRNPRWTADESVDLPEGDD